MDHEYTDRFLRTTSSAAAEDMGTLEPFFMRSTPSSRATLTLSATQWSPQPAKTRDGGGTKARNREYHRAVRTPAKPNADSEGKPNGIPGQARTPSEGSDAGISIVQEVFGFVKRNLSGA
jgi:hypothetical protein